MLSIHDGISGCCCLVVLTLNLGEVMMLLLWLAVVTHEMVRNVGNSLKAHTLYMRPSITSVTNNNK